MSSNNYQNRFIKHRIITNCSNQNSISMGSNKLIISLSASQLENLLYHDNRHIEFAYKFGKQKLDIKILKEEVY